MSLSIWHPFGQGFRVWKESVNRNKRTFDQGRTLVSLPQAELIADWMNWAFPLVCLFVGGAITLLLIPLLRRHSIGERTRSFHQTHKNTTSRFGGVALAASFVVVSSIILGFVTLEPHGFDNALTVIFAALAMCLIGLLDDIRPLGAKKKLLAQIVIASLAYYGGLEIQSFRIPGFEAVVDFGTASFPVTVFWIVALTNLINLIDGVDGLAGGIALMLMCLLTYAGLGAGLSFPVLCAAGMAGALLGFLKFNFPPAKIYMGDAGAYLLGSLIALLTLVNSQKGTVVAALIAPLFALALPIIDVALAILRRGMKGLPIFRPDRAHIHHRLLQSGFSRKKTVLVLYALSLIFLVLAVAVFWSDGRWVPFLFGFLCLVLLVAARRVSFSRDWFAVGRVVVNSIELRKESRYALVLSEWLRLEAERCVSLGELWEGFSFLVRKFGFSYVRLITEITPERTWRSPDSASSASDRRQMRFELNIGDFVAMEFGAPSEFMDERQFDLLSELAAEAWCEAAGNWQKLAPPLLRRRPLAMEKAVLASAPPNEALVTG